MAIAARCSAWLCGTGARRSYRLQEFLLGGGRYSAYGAHQICVVMDRESIKRECRTIQDAPGRCYLHYRFEGNVRGE